MAESKQTKIIIIFIIVLLALVAAWPVSLLMRKANHLETGVSPQELQVNVNLQAPQDNNYVPAAMRGPTRGVSYNDADTELIIPVRANLKTFGPKDFNLVGRAPWALLTTVARNSKDIPMIRYIFSHPTVVQAFLSRPDVAPLVSDPNALYKAAQNEYRLSVFFNYDAVKTVLSDPAAIDAIAKSALMANILNGNAAQYFIKNPKAAAAVINKSPTLTALKHNPAIANAVRNHQATRNIAGIILK